MFFVWQIRLNLFRSLPTRSLPSESGEGDDEEEMFVDPEWPHLFVVYELLLALVRRVPCRLLCDAPVVVAAVVLAFASLSFVVAPLCFISVRVVRSRLLVSSCVWYSL